MSLEWYLFIYLFIFFKDFIHFYLKVILLLGRCFLCEYTEISLRQHTSTPLDLGSSEARAATTYLRIYFSSYFSQYLDT